MTVKEIIRKTCIGKAIIYFRYLIYRFIAKRFLASHETLYSPVDIQKHSSTDITFFGYYNLKPTNPRNEIIYCSVKNESLRGSEKYEASIRFLNSNGQLKKIATTRAWNWQQGCMLQWMPPKFEQIIFNDYEYENDRYISKLINNNGQTIRVYEIPIYSISPDGQYALSLNFDRLSLMRPDYGYFNKKNKAIPPDDNDGIWLLNMDTGKSNLLITLEQLKHLMPCNTMTGAKHKVNHIDINLSGRRFMFLHRWVGPQGRFMRLITANRDGTDLFVLNGDRMTSHSCWVNDNEIISYCNVEGEGDGYFRFIDKQTGAKFISEKLPKQDGHPSLSPDGKWLLTDTYPALARMSLLVLYNMEDDKVMRLGRFYQPLKYQSEMRIDLHPKWSSDGNNIFFESGHTGKRRLYRMDVSKIIHA